MFFASFALLRRLLLSGLCVAVLLGLTVVILPAAGQTTTRLPQEDAFVYLPLTIREGNPAEAPVTLPPNDYAALIERLAAAGYWTEAEGIIQVLEVVLNFRESTEVPNFNTVLSGELQPVFVMAQAYVDKGDDPALQAEMAQLLTLLLPSESTIDAYAEPLDSYTPGRSEASTSAECAQVWKTGFPADDWRAAGLSTPCFLYSSQSIGGFTDLRVYRSLSLTPTAEYEPYFDAALEAMVDSTNIYKEFGEVPDTTLVFTPFADPTDGESTITLAATTPGVVVAWVKCPIVIYAPAFQGENKVSIDEFKQTIAHEMFHCYQGKHFSEQHRPGSDNIKWWTEGSAEYFGNVVYPTFNHEHDFLESFEKQSAQESILNLDYGNFIFFQYLANQFGNEAILKLIEGLPTSANSTIRDQAIALDRFSPNAAPESKMETIFHQFGQNYFDGLIADTSGELLPTKAIPRVYTGDVQKGDVGDYSETGGDFFGLNRKKFTYVEGKSFVQTVDVNESVLQSKTELFQGQTTGGWSELPAELSSYCENEYVALVLVTTTNVNRAGDIHLETEVTEAEERPCNCYYEATIAGSVSGTYRGPAYYSLTQPDIPLYVSSLGNHWTSSFATDSFVVDQTGDFPLSLFSLTDTNGRFFELSTPDFAGSGSVTLVENNGEALTGQVIADIYAVNVSGEEGPARLYLDFKAAPQEPPGNDLAAACDAEWE